MKTCDFASCPAQAHTFVDGWGFCDRHVTEHHEIAFMDRFASAGLPSTSRSATVVTAESVARGTSGWLLPSGDLAALLRVLAGTERLAA